ncbi:GlmU family protein [Roseivirga sp. E12]|uniref:GlmU family protein n=1 Tax=Roseivirga sp. E12 TaxID=2819237 RepID=UPI001ABC366C|nr:GlmU family protein [Roseivirga sp. E12]MBO3699616.1 GlmU family protein [Roseivirga sp. E12]
MDMNLYDPAEIRSSLLPFTFTRPVADIRVGILKISEKWEHFGFSVGFLTEEYLSAKFKSNNGSLKVNGALCPDESLVSAIKSLKEGQKLVSENTVLAQVGEGKESVEFRGPIRLIANPWEIFQHNKEQILLDYALLTKGRTSADITDPNTIVYNSENIFIEEGAEIKAAILNAEEGPIYIGKNAQVHEGAIIKGAFALCEGSHVNMGAKIKGDTTIGPYSKIGGEISNSVIFGYSNKGHDGFLGNSVIGEWCNLGADTNTSNLKNNYAAVKLWNYQSGRFANTGLQFCGLMMGDHAKCGINTMFNTGTVVGVGSNVFGSGYPRNFVPSFAWGGASGLTTFQLRKFYEVAEAVMKRRSIELDDQERDMLSKVFELTAAYRIWENKA